MGEGGGGGGRDKNCEYISEKVIQGDEIKFFFIYLKKKLIRVTALSTLLFLAGASCFRGASPDLPFSRHFLPF